MQASTYFTFAGPMLLGVVLIVGGSISVGLWRLGSIIREVAKHAE